MDSYCLLRPNRGKPSPSPISTATRAALRLALGGCVALWLAGCASAPSQNPPAATAAPKMISMEEWLAQGRAASNEGNREKARAAYRAAAQGHPAEKMPWLRLAEDYFNAQDYGNAVIAAQEALQRDGQDGVAHGILAMSGLRLTAASLVALRQDTAYPVGSRDEAITVARSLRDALGATALLTPAASGSPANRPRRAAPPPGAAVMPPAPAPATAAAGTGTGAVPRAAATTPYAAPAVVPVSGTTLPAARPAAPGPSGSPLDKLR